MGNNKQDDGSDNVQNNHKLQNDIIDAIIFIIIIIPLYYPIRLWQYIRYPMIKKYSIGS